MRVLYAVHHPLDPKLGGAPSASIEIATAISKLGHAVDFYSYDEAFGATRRITSSHRLEFPWKLARFLARHGRRFDVLDITTGDGQVWSALARLDRRRRPKMITRSNGLEHLAHLAFLTRARAGREQVSWRYPLYNGGLRLWEVKQSIRLADGAVVLNETERRFAVDRLGAKAETTRVIPHGLNDYLLKVSAPSAQIPDSGNLARLCFVGNWGRHKGAADIVSAVKLLLKRGREVSLLIAGANRTEAEVLADFPEAARPGIRVVPRYDRRDLPKLLGGSEFLVFPSHFEGFCLAIVEAMACGVIPIATTVGAAPDVISDGVNGFLVPLSQPTRIADVVESVLDDEPRRQSLRVAAQESSRRYRWSATAEKTLELYRAAGAPVG